MEVVRYSMVEWKEKARRTVLHGCPRKKKAVSVGTLPSS